MLDRVLVLNANQWDMTDDDTGERRMGTTVHYCSADYLENGTTRGVPVFKETAPHESFDSLSVLPGIYDTKFVASTVRDRRGNIKRGMAPASFAFVEEFDLSGVIGAEAVAS